MIEQIFRIAAWLSQGVNVILLGGSEDMTVSARCHVNQNQPKWSTTRKVLNAIFFWQEDHCKTSFAQDEKHAIEVLTINKL